MVPSSNTVGNGSPSPGALQPTAAGVFGGDAEILENLDSFRRGETGLSSEDSSLFRFKLFVGDLDGELEVSLEII
jgi:hypothetical protein